MSSFSIAKAIETISSIVRTNIDDCQATDIYRTAHELRDTFPALHLDELIALVEIVVVSLDGAALWFDQSRPVSGMSDSHL